MKDYLQQPARDREFLEHIHGRAGLPQERIKSALYETFYLRFSKTEVLHLAIATALVTAVGMSFYRFQFRWDFLVIFISAFIIHELGHKFLAQVATTENVLRYPRVFYGFKVKIAPSLSSPPCTVAPYITPDESTTNPAYG